MGIDGLGRKFWLAKYMESRDEIDTLEALIGLQEDRIERLEENLRMVRYWASGRLSDE